MKKFAKIAFLALVAGSLMLSACARRHAAQPVTTVPDYVQSGK